MIFVVDNNIFSRTLRNMSLKVYSDMVYTPWEKLIQEGTIISVDEVFEELEKFFGKKTDEYKWLKDNKKCFQYLNDEEFEILTQIFANKKYREGIKEASLRNGTPEADAMIVAKAKAKNAIVVTAESNKKPNSEKIPNICVDFGVSYIKIEDFHQILMNVYKGLDLLNGVVVLNTLELEDEEE